MTVSEREQSARKTRAQTALRRAVKAGRIARPDRCEGCDAQAEVHAHHDDYSKPLVVRWLCRGCHAAEHATEPPWVATARQLRAAGESYSSIARQLGKSHSAVYKRLNPAAAKAYNRQDAASPSRQSAKRSHERLRKRALVRRGKCTECGDPMGAGVPYDGVCIPCRDSLAAARRVERTALIERWWAAGWSMRRIADALGWSRSSIGREIDRLRAMGADLPYRYRSGPRRQQPKHPQAVRPKVDAN